MTTTNPLSTKAKLVNKVELNPKYLFCTFELVQPFTRRLQAGQYVSLRIGDQGELRSYSVASSPEFQNSFELLVDVTPQGIGTTFLKNMAIGNEVEILGPLGRFTLAPDQASAPVVLIGTGSGVAPLRSMLMQLLNISHSTQPIELLWGERFAADLIWVEDFRNWEKQYPNFKFTPTISQPTPADTQFAQGRVTGIIEQRTLLPNESYYLCGNKAMITDVEKILLSRGVAPTSIFFEKFY